MTRLFRGFCAALSTVGLFASLAAYFASFWGFNTGPTNHAGLWIFLYIGGVFLLYLPVVVTEYEGAMTIGRLFWKRFAETRPGWSVAAIQTASLIGAAHMALFIVLTHGDSIKFENRAFMLGHDPISRERYLSLLGWETRFFASILVSTYLFLALYWWFPSARAAPDPVER